MKVEIQISGVTPLLMNRFAEESEISSTSGHAPAHRGSSKGSPRDQAERTAYRDHKTGDLYIPGPNVFATLVAAGQFHKLGKNKMTTQKSSLVPAGILVDELMLPLGTKEFEVDSRRVRIPATGGCIMRHRARLDEWKVNFTLDVDTDMFSANVVRALCDDAGKKIGLGDYRPATRGPFGRFVVTKWKTS